MTTQMEIQRFSLVSAKSFNETIGVIEEGIAHPNMTELSAAIRCASSDREMQELIQATVGQPGLMLFAKFDQGVVIYKGSEREARGVVRLLIGNPLIMASMARHVPDAGSYAPVTVLIDERSDGIHLSYDRMTSFLAPYKSAEALEIAKLLDTKIENLLRRAASL